MTDACYLAHFFVDIKRNKIYDGHRHWQVEPKVMAVLACLMRHPGEVFSKDTLLQEVWPDTAIGSEVLTRAVSELRKIFGDEAKHPKFIETIYKKGYRLMVSPEIPSLNVSKSREPLPPVTPTPMINQSRQWSLRPATVLSVSLLMLAIGTGWWLVSPLGSQTPSPKLKATRPLPITSLSGHEFRSPMSPDGHQIAFVWKGLEPHHSSNIFLKTIDEEGAIQFTHSDLDVDYPTWSPDGKYLAYVRGKRGKGSVMVKPVIGGQTRELLQLDGNFTGLDWSPDGKWLAYGAASSPFGPSQIFIFSLDTHKTTQLTSPESGIVGDSQPFWKKDGLGLAFIRRWHVGDGDDLFWIPLDRNAQALDAPKQLTFDRLPISGVTWLPKDQGLIMIHLRDGYSRLCHLKLEDQIIQSFPISHAILMAPYVDRNGGRLTYTRKKVERNIWSKSLKASVKDVGQRIVFSTFSDISPALSPDGKTLAWISMRSGYREIWIAEPDGSQPRQVSRFAKGHISAPIWDPGNEHVLVTFTHQGNSDICRVPIKGGSVEHLTSEPSKEAHGFISNDGQWLYFASNREQGWQIWRKHLEKAFFERVTQHGGYTASQTDDGQLIYTKFGAKGIWKRNADGGETRVLDAYSPKYYRSWQVRGNDLYYLSWHGDYYELYRQNLSGGERELVTGIGHLGWKLHGFTLSPDGSHLIFGQLDSLESDIMMVELAQN